jgi:S-adenosylmethionine hydrolase
MKMSPLALLALVCATLFCTVLAACAPGPKPVPAGGLTANITRISEEFANINTDLSAKTLAKYGITLQESFSLRHKDHTIKVLFGKDYSDVAKGDWVGLIEEDGTLQIAISFGHAATELGAKAGDRVYIEPLDLD